MLVYCHGHHQLFIKGLASTSDIKWIVVKEDHLIRKDPQDCYLSEFSPNISEAGEKCPRLLCWRLGLEIRMKAKMKMRMKMKIY